MAKKPPDEDNLFRRLKATVKTADAWVVYRIAMGVGLFLFLVAILAVDFSPKAISGLEVSKPSPTTILAPRMITLRDAMRTEELRRRAASSVAPIYRYDPSGSVKARIRITQFYQQLWQLLSNETIGPEQRRQMVDQLVPRDLPESHVTWLLSLGEDDIKGLREKTVELSAMVMTDKISQKQLGAKREEVKRRATAIEDRHAAKLVGLVASGNLRVNNFIDRSRTNRAIARAVDKVQPVTARKLKGETIVSEGEIITPAQGQFLRESGFTGNLIPTSAGQVIGKLVIALILVVLGLIYLREFQPKVYRNNRLLLLVSVILAAFAAIAKGLAPLFPPMLIPVAGAAMLTTILVRPTTGIMMAITASLVTGIIVNSADYWVFAFMTSLFAVYLTARISARSDLTRAGLWLVAAAGMTAVAVGLIKGLLGLDLLVSAGWGVVGGFLAIILTIGTLQFLEHAFNITTDLNLLELSNPTQPLLRELMINAPGTYNHSIITGNLVESVAQEVGANPLLARAGAYYHDIGKIRRPFFFVENQYGDNPHDKTQPNLSYLIIAAHVKEGIELAKKYRLPQEIVDIICQHHGTTLVTYFYTRAKEEAKKSEISESQFRYQGEKPKSREAALVMLADAVEAAARALSKPTHNRVEQLVRKIVKERLRDGQLDESDLTLGDLETIIRGYTQTLTTMYHSRIEYPELEKSPKKRGVVVGRFGGKPVGRSNRSIGS